MPFMMGFDIFIWVLWAERLCLFSNIAFVILCPLGHYEIASAFSVMGGGFPIEFVGFAGSRQQYANR
jgi:hypothetical protein